MHIFRTGFASRTSRGSQQRRVSAAPELFSPVSVAAGDKKGNVKKWLMEVRESTVACLTKVTGQSIQAYLEWPRKQWVLEWPGQVAISMDNNDDLGGTEGIAAGALPEYYQLQCSQLPGLAGLVRGDLSKLARRTLPAMVTIDVHDRDGMEMLVDARLTSPRGVGWVAPLRYYWGPAGPIVMYDTLKPNVVDKCQVSIINSTLLYGFGYPGNSDRLVVTPLMDRCHRTLMGAVALFYGGAPEGARGHGQDRGHEGPRQGCVRAVLRLQLLGRPGLPGHGQVLQGLASSGAWCCCVEFDRVNLEELSVIAVQVATITWAIRARKEYFFFEGTELMLVPSRAVNITMNTGYAGRTELPENLKALLRPCTMMVPDYSLIGEIMLYSFGFRVHEGDR